MRAPRGYSCPFLLGRKAMASLLAACRKHFPAACGLHARTKPVRLGPASLTRLICALWQNNPPSFMRVRLRTSPFTATPRPANTHRPPQRPTPNHQVYLPSARRVKNPHRLARFPRGTVLPLRPVIARALPLPQQTAIQQKLGIFSQICPFTSVRSLV